MRVLTLIAALMGAANGRDMLVPFVGKGGSVKLSLTSPECSRWTIEPLAELELSPELLGFDLVPSAVCGVNQNESTAIEIMSRITPTDRILHAVVVATSNESEQILSTRLHFSEVTALHFGGGQTRVLGTGSQDRAFIVGVDAYGGIFSSMEGLKFHWSVQQLKFCDEAGVIVDPSGLPGGVLPATDPVASGVLAVRGHAYYVDEDGSNIRRLVEQTFDRVRAENNNGNGGSGAEDNKPSASSSYSHAIDVEPDPRLTAAAHVVVLEGISSGRVCLCAQLDVGFQTSVPSICQRVNVVENLITSPAGPLHMIPASRLNLRLLRHRAGLPDEEVALPNNQFVWLMSNPRVAIVGIHHGTVDAISTGSSRLVIVDMNIRDRVPLAQEVITDVGESCSSSEDDASLSSSIRMHSHDRETAAAADSTTGSADEESPPECRSKEGAAGNVIVDIHVGQPVRMSLWVEPVLTAPQYAQKLRALGYALHVQQQPEDRGVLGGGGNASTDGISTTPPFLPSGPVLGPDWDYTPNDIPIHRISPYLQGIQGVRFGVSAPSTDGTASHSASGGATVRCSGYAVSTCVASAPKSFPVLEGHTYLLSFHTMLSSGGRAVAGSNMRYNVTVGTSQRDVTPFVMLPPERAAELRAAATAAAAAGADAFEPLSEACNTIASDKGTETATVTATAAEAAEALQEPSSCVPAAADSTHGAGDGHADEESPQCYRGTTFIGVACWPPHSQLPEQAAGTTQSSSANAVSAAVASSAHARVVLVPRVLSVSPASGEQSETSTQQQQQQQQETQQHAEQRIELVPAFGHATPSPRPKPGYTWIEGQLSSLSNPVSHLTWTPASGGKLHVHGRFIVSPPVQIMWPMAKTHLPVRDAARTSNISNSGGGGSSSGLTTIPRVLVACSLHDDAQSCDPPATLHVVPQGGDGEYHFAIHRWPRAGGAYALPFQSAQVDSSGVLSVATTGKFALVVTQASSAFNGDAVLLHTLPPARIFFVDSAGTSERTVLDVVVGADVVLSVGAADGKHRPFDLCDSLSAGLSWEVTPHPSTSAHSYIQDGDTRDGDRYDHHDLAAWVVWNTGSRSAVQDESTVQSVDAALAAALLPPSTCGAALLRPTAGVKQALVTVRSGALVATLLLRVYEPLTLVYPTLEAPDIDGGRIGVGVGSSLVVVLLGGGLISDGDAVSEGHSSNGNAVSEGHSSDPSRNADTTVASSALPSAAVSDAVYESSLRVCVAHDTTDGGGGARNCTYMYTHSALQPSQDGDTARVTHDVSIDGLRVVLDSVGTAAVAAPPQQTPGSPVHTSYYALRVHCAADAQPQNKDNIYAVEFTASGGARAYSASAVETPHAPFQSTVHLAILCEYPVALETDIMPEDRSDAIAPTPSALGMLKRDAFIVVPGESAVLAVRGVGASGRGLLNVSGCFVGDAVSVRFLPRASLLPPRGVNISSVPYTYDRQHGAARSSGEYARAGKACGYRSPTVQQLLDVYAPGVRVVTGDGCAAPAGVGMTGYQQQRQPQQATEQEAQQEQQTQTQPLAEQRQLHPAEVYWRKAAYSGWHLTQLDVKSSGFPPGGDTIIVSALIPAPVVGLLAVANGDGSVGVATRGRSPDHHTVTSLSSRVHVSVAAPVSLEPRSVLLFPHPNASERVRCMGGSSLEAVFEVDAAGKRCVVTAANSPMSCGPLVLHVDEAARRELVIAPLIPSAGTGTIACRDSGVEGARLSDPCSVTIADAAEVHLSTPRYVRAGARRLIRTTVTAGENGAEQFSPEALRYMNFTISAEPPDCLVNTPDGPVFVAARAGDVTLRATVTRCYTEGSRLRGGTAGTGSNEVAVGTAAGADSTTRCGVVVSDPVTVTVYDEGPFVRLMFSDTESTGPEEDASMSAEEVKRPWYARAWSRLARGTARARAWTAPEPHRSSSTPPACSTKGGGTPCPPPPTHGSLASRSDPVEDMLAAPLQFAFGWVLPRLLGLLAAVIVVSVGVSLYLNPPKKASAVVMASTACQTTPSHTSFNALLHQTTSPAAAAARSFAHMALASPARALRSVAAFAGLDTASDRGGESAATRSLGRAHSGHSHLSRPRAFTPSPITLGPPAVSAVRGGGGKDATVVGLAHSTTASTSPRFDVDGDDRGFTTSGHPSSRPRAEVEHADVSVGAGRLPRRERVLVSDSDEGDAMPSITPTEPFATGPAEAPSQAVVPASVVPSVAGSVKSPAAGSSAIPPTPTFAGGVIGSSARIVAPAAGTSTSTSSSPVHGRSPRAVYDSAMSRGQPEVPER